MPITSKRLAGPGFIILNVLRAMNITALLAVIAASMIMVIKTFTASKFFFFDGATHIITALSAMFLVVSECSIFKEFFARNWPLLSPSHGFNFLGFSMVVLGNNILGNLNKEATSQKSLGLPFWRVVIGSGVVVFALGFVNIVANYTFRDTHLSVTARSIRSKGAVAISDAETYLESGLSTGKPSSIVTSFPTPHSNAYAPSSAYSSTASPLKTRSPVKAFMRNARDSILPSYRSQVPPYPRSPPPVAQTSANPYAGNVFLEGSGSGEIKRSGSGKLGRKNSKGREETITRVPDSPQMNISAPMNVNPQFAHLVRPDMAHHPSSRRDGSF